jgi:hypothetical protein
VPTWGRMAFYCHFPFTQTCLPCNQALVELHMPLMMSQESSVEVPYNKSVLGAWINRCLEVRAVREVLGNVAFPSARVSSANVNKAGPTFCGDVRGADLAAEIVGHSYRVIDLNADFKKAVSQRNQEKAAKEKATAETPKEAPKESASPAPTTFSLGEPIKADLPKEDKIAKVRLIISMFMRALLALALTSCCCF